MARRKSIFAYDGRVTNGYEFAPEAKEYMVRVATMSFGSVRVNPANADVYDPKPHQLVPKAGAWGLISRRLPPMEHDLHEHVRPGRIFYIEHDGDNTDEKGFTPDGTYKVRLLSPWGELKLWPYEYTVLDPQRVITLWTDGAIVFHPTAVDDVRMNQIVFYARSRGIGLADAAVMALGTFAGNVGWFEPHPSVTADVEAICDRLNEWPWSTKKRAAARRQRKEANRG